jgi:hypothetical protein
MVDPSRCHDGKNAVIGAVELMEGSKPGRIRLAERLFLRVAKGISR